MNAVNWYRVALGSIPFAIWFSLLALFIRLAAGA